MVTHITSAGREPPGNVLPAEHAAQELGIGVRELLRLAAEGHVPSHNVLGTRLFLRQELAGWRSAPTRASD